MKKLINTASTMVSESLEGLAMAHADLLVLQNPHRVVQRRHPKKGKVALVSGGGSGHEPLHTGMVGFGMLDAACAGEVFTSPTPDQILAAIRSQDTGAGVLLLVKNYAGDVLNFELANEFAGQSVRTLVMCDDVATAQAPQGSRGIAGTLVFEKLLGAAAEEGTDLNQLIKLGEKISRCTRTMGVALSAAIVPATGMPTFTLDDDEMEVGVGIHSEAGVRRSRLLPADEVARLLLDDILRELPSAGGSAQCLLLINGLGGSPLMELYLIARAATKLLQDAGLTPVRFLVGNYVTSLEMAGCSITVTLLDDELVRLWDFPVHTVALRWGM